MTWLLGNEYVQTKQMITNIYKDEELQSSPTIIHSPVQVKDVNALRLLAQELIVVNLIESYTEAREPTLDGPKVRIPPLRIYRHSPEAVQRMDAGTALKVRHLMYSSPVECTLHIYEC